MQKLLTDMPGGKNIVVKTKNTTTSTTSLHSQIRNGAAVIQPHGSKAPSTVESDVSKKLLPNQRPANMAPSTVGGANSEHKPESKNRTTNRDEDEDEVPSDDEDAPEPSEAEKIQNTPKNSEVHQASEADSEQIDDTDNEHNQNPPLRAKPNSRPNAKPNSPLRPVIKPAVLHNREGSDNSDGSDIAHDDTDTDSTGTHALKNSAHTPTASETGHDAIQPNKTIKHTPISPKPSTSSPMPNGKRTTKPAPKPSLPVKKQPRPTPNVVPISTQSPSTPSKDSPNPEMPRITVTIRRLTPEE